jgi:hypothetical protein
MPRIRFVSLCVLLLAAIPTARPAAAADEAALVDPVVGKLHDKVMRFFDRIASGEENAAFTDLLLNSQLPEQAGAVKGLVDKSKEIISRYGARRDSEQISAKRIGKDVVLLKYLFKCEKFPVVWYFIYYRDFARVTPSSDDYWVVISVRFDTQVELLGY